MTQDTQRHNNKKPNDQQRLSQQLQGEQPSAEQVGENRGQAIASVQQNDMQS
ncbi:hypothetical protein [Paenibacillus hamazuiensis]|uniref:hypothetical protein n=1 Tax=Paenibacillus hamazuiensis TaxID=2936508 RepID=UPI00200BC1C3|nr:hypothetical protein [Paenibacillus hamazuiensis]